MSSWFQISADFNTYRQYRIGLWDTGYDINPIIPVDTGPNIVDMAEIADIDER